MRKIAAVLLIVAALAAVSVWAEESPNFKLLNRGKEGQEFDFKSGLVPGKLTIVDFYSEYCAPCRVQSKALEELVKKDSGIVVAKLDINRPGVKGIDFESPLFKQYGLDSLPHLKVYNGKGKLLAEGKAASDLVKKLLKENGLE